MRLYLHRQTGREQHWSRAGTEPSQMVRLLTWWWIPHWLFSLHSLLSNIAAGKPSLEDHTAWHPNQRGYMQVTALDVLLQLGQILNFNEKFLTVNMIHIKWLAVIRVCAALTDPKVLDLCSVTSNMACNGTANKLRGELGTIESDLSSVIPQLNAMSQGLLETEKTLTVFK